MQKRSGRPVNFYLRLLLHPGTPENVGRGVAAGFFSACILPVGHMPLAFLLATLIRGAKTISVLATWITNPLTMPFLYPVQCYIGSFLIGRPLSYALIRQLVLNVLHDPSSKTIQALSYQVIFSFFAGGLLTGSLMAGLGYFLTTRLIRRHRRHRAQKKDPAIFLKENQTT